MNIIRFGEEYRIARIGVASGSTATAYLKKPAPGLQVVIVEREELLREHVGESQLPPS